MRAGTLARLSSTGLSSTGLMSTVLLSCLLLLLGLAGCGAPERPPAVSLTPLGAHVEADGGIELVRLVDPQGLPVQVRRLPTPVSDLDLRQLWEQPGAWTVEVQVGGQLHRLPLQVDAVGAVLVEVEAPVGQARHAVGDGEQVELLLVEGEAAQVAVRATALRGGQARIVVGDEAEQPLVQATDQLQPGERLLALAEVRSDASVPVRVELDGEPLTFDIVPRSVGADVFREQVALRGITFPAESNGRRDPARPPGRISLPSQWWQQVLATLGLGFRPRDGTTPWSWWAVELENRGDEPLNLVLRAVVLDDQGQPEPAFRPRMRDGDDGSGVVRVLLRLPPRSTATATLPLYVDEPALSRADARQRTWTRRIDVIPLGSSAPIFVDQAPLYLSRGSTAASLGLVAALVAAALGSLMLALRGPTWLRRARTNELVTVSMFGSMIFLAGAVGRLLTMGLATVLGPFASLLTGLVDDSLRYALLATLLTLLPRPGIASLAVLTGWLLSGFAMGTFSPTDILFVGGRVFWLELFLWLAGVTRVAGWTGEARLKRWLRLGVGFGLASVCTSATGLVLHVVLYRLFLADWYVALVLGGPGFLYVLLACAFAVPFAESLQRIQR